MNLSIHALQLAAHTLGCDVAAVQAVCEVEAPNGGFDAAGRPRILFEGHVFSRLTKGKFDQVAPTVSYPRWVRTFYATGPTPDARNTGEHRRLEIAASYDRDAALRAASWGKFQILGDNCEEAGFPKLQAFINAMYQDEDAQLGAFVSLVQGWGLGPVLAQQRWADFARRYNGPAYADNQYDTKLAAAYRRFKAQGVPA